MAVTKIEKLVIQIDERLGAVLSQFESQKVKVVRLHTTVFEDGLSSKVDELHEWMEVQKLAGVKLNGETKILGMKLNGDARIAFLNGVFIVVGILISKYIP
jgi:ABC-type hemin transport system substrate-binding protein